MRAAWLRLGLTQLGSGGIGWTVLAARTWRDVEELARLFEANAMPYAPRHDQRLARLERNLPRGVAVFEHHGDPPRDQEQQLVAVGMHLAAMRWLSRHEGSPDGVSIDSPGRAGSILDLSDLAVALQSDDRCR